MTNDFDVVALGMLNGNLRADRSSRSDFERTARELMRQLQVATLDGLVAQADREAAGTAVGRLIKKLPDAANPQSLARMVKLGGPLSKDVGQYLLDAEENLKRLSDGRYSFDVTPQRVAKKIQCAKSIDFELLRVSRES